MDSGIDEFTKVRETFLPNGKKYMTEVFRKEKLIETEKFFANGELAQKTYFKNEKILQRITYDRSGDILESLYYEYMPNELVERITKLHINDRDEAAFAYDNYNNIIKIRIIHNSTIIKKLDYRYENNEIYCQEVRENSISDYKCISPPRADEKLLVYHKASSLVMRKLRGTFL